MKFEMQKVAVSITINTYKTTLYSLQIDESSFQCLTCNDVHALNTMSAHFDGTYHKKLYSESRQAYIVSCVANETEKPAGKVSKVVEKPETSVTTAKEHKPDPQNESKNEIVKSPKKSDPPLEIKKEVIPEVSRKHPITLTEPGEKSTPEVKNSEKPKGQLEKGTPDFDEEICKGMKAKNYISVDENGKIWCILCDWVVDRSVDSHTQGKHHQTILKMHNKRMEKKMAITLESEKKLGAQKDDKPQEIRNPILDILPKLEKSDIIVDCKGSSAFCKRCSKALDFNQLAFENHIESIEHQTKDKKEEVKKTANNNKKVEDAKKTQKIENTKKPQSPTTKKAESIKKQEREVDSRASSVASTREPNDDIEKLAKANNLEFNRNSNKIYCHVCDSYLRSSTKVINQHISDITHKNNTVMKPMKPNFIQTAVKMAMKDFIMDLLSIENTLTKDVIINRKYVLNYYSFVMMTQQCRNRCEACEMNLNRDQMEQHKTSQTHYKAMCDTMVIVSCGSEFIREVSDTLFLSKYT